MVRIERVQSDASEQTITAPGEVAFRRSTHLAFVTSGRIASLSVSEGEFVRRGQLLARLDTSVLDAEVERTGLELQRRTDQLQRIEKLFADGWVTRPQLEETQLARQSAEAAAQAAQFNRDGGILKAPGSGIVLSRQAEPGQILSAGQPVVRLGEIASGFVLRVPLSDRDLQRVSTGSSAETRIAALAQRSFSGRVVEVGAQADTRTGSFLVEVSLPPDPGLRAGQIGQAIITVEAPTESQRAILVPASAIFDARGGQGFVYIYDPLSKRVTLQRLDIAGPVGDKVKVTSGIPPNAWVVVSDFDQLENGMAINPSVSGS